MAVSATMSRRYSKQARFNGTGKERSSRWMFQHRAQRPPENLEIQSPAGIFDILDVVANPFLEIGAGGAGARYLPQAGDSRADAQAQPPPGRAEPGLAVR